MPTLAEQTTSEILEAGYRVLDNYFSLAPHYPLVRSLLILNKSDRFKLFNIYCIFQNLAQLEEKYGKTLVLPTALTCGTKSFSIRKSSKQQNYCLAVYIKFS